MTDTTRDNAFGQTWIAYSAYTALLTRAEAAEAERDKWRADYTRLLNDRLSGAWREELDAERDALAAKLVMAVESMRLTEAQYMGCGGNLRPDEVVNYMRRLLNDTLAQLTADTPKEGKDNDQ